jgi:hypothetical protein
LTDKPKGERFLGVIVLESDDLVEAIDTAWEMDINPGGEIMSFRLPFTEALVPFMDRLLTADEAHLANAKLQGLN